MRLFITAALAVSLLAACNDRPAQQDADTTSAGPAMAPDPSATSTPASNEPTTPPASNDATAADMVTVPSDRMSVNGVDCVLDYEKALKEAGLVPKQELIHGPVDSDAGNIGCPYRIDPAPGTSVKRGSTVTYRSWWEQG